MRAARGCVMLACMLASAACPWCHGPRARCCLIMRVDHDHLPSAVNRHAHGCNHRINRDQLQGIEGGVRQGGCWPFCRLYAHLLTFGLHLACRFEDILGALSDQLASADYFYFIDGDVRFNEGVLLGDVSGRLTTTESARGGWMQTFADYKPTYSALGGGWMHL